MGGHTPPERRDDASLDTVPALQRRHDPPVAARVGDFHQLPREPFIVRLCDAKVTEVQVVLFMPIKPGRHKYQIGVKVDEGGEDRVAPEPAPVPCARPRVGRQPQPNLGTTGVVMDVS